MLLSKVFLSLAAAITVAAQSFTIITPTALTPCQPTLITWSGGTAPYILSAIRGGEVGSADLVTIGKGLTGNQHTWVVNLQGGTYITLKIVDAKGASIWSAPITIQQGSGDLSCLTSSVAGPTAGAGGGSTAAPGTAAGTSAPGSLNTVQPTTTAGGSAGAGSGSGTVKPTGSATPSATGGSGAGRVAVAVNAVAAGIVGAVLFV